MVVACVAGFGVSAAFDQTVDGASTYAAELFGKATPLTYPLNLSTTDNLTDRTTPTVMLTYKNAATATNVAASSTSTVKFDFTNATFTSAVLPAAMVCQTTSDGASTTPTWAACSDAAITVREGGGAGTSSVTFQLVTGSQAIDISAKPAAPATTDGANQMRLVLTAPRLTATGAVSVSSSIATSAGNIPPVVMCSTKDDAATKTVNEAAEACNLVVKTAAAVGVPVAAAGGTQAHIHLDDFKMLAPKADGKAREGVSLGSYTFSVDNKTGSILAPDGTAFNEDAAATLTISVDGDLNEGDKIKVGGSDPKEMTVSAAGGPVSTLVTLSSAQPGLTALKSSKKVDLTYVPAGKERLSHGAEIDVDYMPRFTRVENTALKSSKDNRTTLKLSGVGSEVKAYGLPHAANSKMDKTNVRVRCENGAGMDNMCRVFIECWDDEGMGDIGEVGKLMEGEVDVLQAGDNSPEALSGLTASTRLSCRVLATGEVTVQSLVRDGETGVLINTTAVGGAD